MTNSEAAPICVMFWGRPIFGQDMVGRVKVALSVRDALASHFQLVDITAKSIVGEIRLAPILAAGACWLSSILRGRPLPLQLLIYGTPGRLKRLLKSLPADLQYIYIDGVRMFFLAQALRKYNPGLQIVVDLDDLISRRTRLLMNRRQPMALGQLAENIPTLARLLLTNPTMNRAILFYERITLPHYERQLTQLVDGVVLVSKVDSDALQLLTKDLRHKRASIHHIPPPVTLHEPVTVTPPFNFIFLGTDKLTQNRLTIDYLLTLWQHYNIPHSLTIYGRQTRVLPPQKNVKFAGYVPAVEDIYNSSSILVCPCFVSGGVKTKVLEAFSFGIPVVGNAVTFESIELENYPLQYDTEADLVPFLLNVNEHAEDILEASNIGRTLVTNEYRKEDFSRRWLHAMTTSAFGLATKACLN